MKQLSHERIIGLLNQRALLQQTRNGFNTDDTIKIGEPKMQIELHIAPIRQVVTDAIDAQAAQLDEQLAALGVVVVG